MAKKKKLNRGRAAKGHDGAKWEKVLLSDLCRKKGMRKVNVNVQQRHFRFLGAFVFLPIWKFQIHHHDLKTYRGGGIPNGKDQNAHASIVTAQLSDLLHVWKSIRERSHGVSARFQLRLPSSLSVYLLSCSHFPAGLDAKAPPPTRTHNLRREGERGKKIK